MQVTETLSEGLKREFKVHVPASDLEARVAARLDTLKDRVQLRGFRPGKVPVTHLKRVYGRAVMAETIEAVIQEMNAKIVNDRGLKLAMEPKVTIPQEEKEVERLVGGEVDLAYTLAIEILPKIELADFKNVKLERPVAEVTQAEIDEAIETIAQQNRPFAAKAEDAKVEKDDRATISFIGRIDGNAFEGGTGHDVAVHVGSGTFIPGFEDQIVGMAAGEMRIVKVAFPANYANSELAGKDAEFEVTVASIETPGKVTVDEAFAKSLGLESLDKLKDAVKDRLQRDHAAQSRLRVKRQLLDQLDKLHQFTPPPSLAEQEFQNIWNSVLADLKEQNRSFADEDTTEEKATAEYREIAHRRVRLGLVLAEIGEANKLTVSEEELSRAIVERARQVPGREKEIWDYYRKNPQAVANVRAPLFEEKVVDFILELATVTEKPVSREELYKDDDEKSAEAKA